MKKPSFLLLLAALTAVLTCFFASKSWLFKKNSITEIQPTEEGEDEQQSGAGKQLSSWYQAKGYPDASNLSAKYQKAWEQYLEIKKNSEQPSRISTEGVVSNWTGLGYCSDAGTRIGGRVVCMAIDPNNTNNLWVGSASGGIWRSTNSGSSWTSVPTNLPVLGVSAILVDPSNSNIIYAGTGEVYHTEVGVMGFNVWKTRGTYGIGVIKSINGGTTWSQVMPKVSSDLFAISSMAFLPGNSNTIYACATDGVYRSVDNGTNWTQVYTGINVRDIAINPSNTDEIVISVGNMTNAVKGIFRTTNGNNATPAWTQITSGLPSPFIGSIVLDNSGAGVLVASVGRGSGNEVYRSTDFGANWSAISTSNHCSYQFWFAHTIAVNPFATDSLIYGGVSIYRHKTAPTIGRATISGLHSDHHDIKFDPVRRGTVYVCNDGGVYKSTDGVNFSAINTGLNATQFYASLGVSKTNANRMVGGLQDNGQVVYNGTNWVTPTGGGGDGTSCAVHPTNDNIILACRDARAIKRSTDGGGSFGELTNSSWAFDGDSRTAFVAPIAFAPSNGNIVYQASDNIHISSNAGASFSNNILGTTPPYPATTPNAFIEAQHKTAIALAVSPTNSSKLYVSTSPFAQADNDVNTIYVTGTPNILKTTTPATTPYTSIKGTLPDRFVMDFAISPNSDDSVYVVLGGFGTSHVYLTPDGGTTWLNRGASGLPDVPFNAILIDPRNPKILYAGCDFGVYVSHNRGINWYDYNTGFYDATLIMDLQVDANNKLIAATHGKGVFRSDLFDPPVTLPVTFTSFTGHNINDYNELKWDVEQEYNLSHYQIERSLDGFNFQTINNKTARNLIAPSTYTYSDNIGSIVSSSFYYRLKAINMDGTYFYSDIVFIRANRKSSFTILGNPFTSQLSFKYNAAEAGNMTVQLMDLQGRTLRKEQQRITVGPAYYTLNNLSSLPPGMYVLELWINRERYTEKIIKQ